ncbi:hypothetical protein SESBI_17081 [Sesbania bispinosa]|nr:hypothetical protein SESBI_17081 [Sesbania bispinosa]
MATPITPLAVEQENTVKTLDPTPQPPNGTPDPDDAPLSHVQKKIRRAERFGISLQLSEQDKRNSRAQRFGTASTILSSDASKLEEQKRKARAERFGMPVPSTAADEDAKKKARLARFAPISKIDPLEEDKRRARALRFSNPSSATAGQAGDGA